MNNKRQLDDKRFKTEKDRLHKLARKWQRAMGLQYYKIQLYYDGGYHPKGFEAETHMGRWQYHEFEITFYLPETMDKSDEDLEEMVVHELAHCLLAPISVNMSGTDTDDPYRRQVCEFTTEAVRKGIMWSYEEGIADADIKQKQKAKDAAERGNIDTKDKIKEKDNAQQPNVQ